MLTIFEDIVDIASGGENTNSIKNMNTEKKYHEKNFVEDRMEDVCSDEKINYQFKILYAIGIVLVVANHCGSGGISLFYEFFPAYAFHVALFMFSSGYFYKESVEKKKVSYVITLIRETYYHNLWCIPDKYWV